MYTINALSQISARMARFPSIGSASSDGKGRFLSEIAKVWGLVKDARQGEAEQAAIYLRLFRLSFGREGGPMFKKSVAHLRIRLQKAH